MTSPSPSVRAENAAQLVLMLGVGSVAACASWSHVVDLAETNGQPGWLAVADAAVLETLAVSMGLDVRRRRRNGESTRFALCVLVSAVALQLAAQVAQAPVTFWGWTMAALPAVGFLLLVKVAMTRTVAVPWPAGETATPATVVPEPDDEPTPAAAPTPQLPSLDKRGSADPTSTAPRGASGPGIQDALLDAGRHVAADLDRRDVRLSRASLAVGLRDRGVRVGTGRAGELLAALRTERDHAAREQTANARASHDRAAEDHRDRHLASVGTRL